MLFERLWVPVEWTKWQVSRISTVDIINCLQIQTSKGEVIVTNDGATILKSIQALHPAAKMVCNFSSLNTSSFIPLAVGRFICRTGYWSWGWYYFGRSFSRKPTRGRRKNAWEGHPPNDCCRIVYESFIQGCGIPHWNLNACGPEWQRQSSSCCYHVT